MLKRLFGTRRRRRAWAAVLVAPPALTVIAFAAAVTFWPYPPNVDRLPPASLWVTDRDGRPLAAYASRDGQWCRPLTFDQLGPHLRDAIVAVEDGRFYTHGGVDWPGATAASWQDVTSLSVRRGASTLTMQVQRLRQPTPRRSLLGKLVQAIRACQIERRSTKAEVLTEYLNRAPFGGNLTGAGAASWRYFGRPCQSLSLGQAALLAGLPQSPNRFRPDRHPAAAAERRDHVLARMVACGMITDDQRRRAAAEPVDAAWCALPQDATDVGLRPTLLGLARSQAGRTLATTIDLAVQQRAAGMADDAVRDLSASHVSAAAVVVLDTPTGECLAAVSRSAVASAVDLTASPRSSGSALKPIIYAAAFDAGVCGPSTVLDDAPTAWAGYEPGNYDRRFDGPEPAAVALARSRNVPALAVLSRVGVDRAVSVMAAVGLTTVARTPDRYGLTLAVGGAEVTPMELAGAYATLARGGVDRRPTLLRGTATRSRAAALRPSSCLAALRCIADVDRTRTVWPAAVPLGPAWKTGTSSGHRDAWCAAVTPRRTVVVWLGNADGATSAALVGQDAAAPLALRVLSAVDGGGGAGFTPPADFLAATVTPVTPPTRAVAILSPADGQEIVRDPAVAAAEQRVPLRARSTGAVWWFVDGEPAGHGGEWWDATPGSHEVRAVDALGHAAVVHVRVR